MTAGHLPHVGNTQTAEIMYLSIS